MNARLIACAAVALLAAGCANVGEAGITLVQTESPVPVEAGLADADFVGTWSGRVRGDSEDYGVVVVFTTDGGELGGSVEYPELNCSGDWTLTAADGTVRDFTEIVDEGGRDTCIPVTRIEIRHRGGALSYEVTQPPGQYPIRATLTRIDL